VSGGESTRIFVSLGHAAKIRPQDLVGAIANETSLSGRQIGAIEITHKFSIVEIPEQAVDEVIGALQATLIKGRKAKVERYKPRTERAERPGAKT
jgi:ATP-dependent RNA helicase DeaD